MNRFNRRRFGAIYGNPRYDSIRSLNDAAVYVLLTWDGKAEKYRLFFEASKDEKKTEIETEMMRLRDVGIMLLNDRIKKNEVLEKTTEQKKKVDTAKEKRSRELQNAGTNADKLFDLITERRKQLQEIDLRSYPAQ